MKRTIAIILFVTSLVIIIPSSVRSQVIGGVSKLISSVTTPLSLSSSGVLSITNADATHSGVVSTGTQTIAGAKTFTGTFAGGGTGTFASTLQVTNGVFDAGYGNTHTVRGYPAAGNGTATTLTSQTTITTGNITCFSPDSGSTCTAYVKGDGKFVTQATDSSGTPGAATINKPSGQSAIAASAASVVITNSTVTTSSVVLGQLQANDGTCTSIQSIVPAAGSFTITVNAACTGNTKVGWIVFD